MNRGVARQRVFFTRADGQAFESLLGDGHKAFGVDVHAFCLMPNHFHLLVNCPDGGLSAYMQRLSSMYTRYLNGRLGRDGPIFRGRFRSLVIQSEQYLACAGRYIHRNPLDIRPPVDLAEYRWSSFRHYCRRATPPSWLSLSLSARYGGTEDYRAFVESDAPLPTEGSVDWAISMAVAEHLADGGERAPRHRAVAVAMLDQASAGLVETLDRSLGFPSAEARRAARYRVRQRYEEDLMMRAVVLRALELAA